jgi:prepilin peptidase CpaA
LVAIVTVVACFCLLAVGVIAIAAAYRDVVSFTLPNILTLSVALVFLPFAGTMYFLGTLSVSQLGFALLAGGIVFLVGLLLFVLGALGGGDVKYLAAAALWAYPVGLTNFLLVTSISGAVVAMAYLLMARSSAPGSESAGKGIRARLARPMPYGVAISVGLAYTIVRWGLQLRG